MIKKAIFLLMLLPAVAFSGTSRGERFVRQLWNDMKELKIDTIKEHTSKEFQGILNAMAFNRYQQLDWIKNHHPDNFTLSNIKVTEGVNIIVVSYNVAFADSENIEKTGHYISVWKKYGDEWKWVAHADITEIAE